MSNVTSRAFAYVDTAALAANYRTLCAHARGARVIAVIKANAYGHGLSLVVPTLLAEGCSAFAVADANEAITVRLLAPHADILILGYTPPTLAEKLAALGITQTVFSAEYAAELNAAAATAHVRVRVHAKLDGGMCRLGYAAQGDEAALLALAGAENLALTGLYTHFPCADSDVRATNAALADFRAICARLGRDRTLTCHAAASAALLTVPASHLDAVRPGLALYGIPPVATTLALRPVLSLHAPIVQIRDVPCGTPVGYGGDFVTSAPARIGVLPIGYADGLCRAMSGFPVTLRHGSRRFSVPIVGRICMDLTMLDLTHTPASVGDVVTVFDDARAPAAYRDTIPYEILTALAARVARCEKGDAP